MTHSPYLQKDFVVGFCLQLFSLISYGPVTRYFYYGGGWPFVQIVFVIVYSVGIRYIFKSSAPTIVKFLLCFWWILYGAGMIIWSLVKE